MKKITCLVLLLTAHLSFADIIVNDIEDVTFTGDTTLPFDFNNDGTPEFTFFMMGPAVGSFFDSTMVNFYSTGTLNSGHGWDVMKSLEFGTAINASSLFGAEGDAYINPGWAYESEMFPEGDSYVGTKFKIGANTYYGWILIQSEDDVITVKSYAYNNVTGEGITAGEVGTMSSGDFTTHTLSITPNPTTDKVYFKSNDTLSSVLVYDISGRLLLQPVLYDNSIDLTSLPQGVYILQVSQGQKQSVFKIIKE